MLAAARTKVRQPLFEEFLELSARATLEQHVPVAARSLGIRVVEDDRLVADKKRGLMAALLALPGVGCLGLSRENNFALGPAFRAQVCVT